MPMQPQKQFTKGLRLTNNVGHYVFSFDDRDIHKLNTMSDAQLKGVVEDLWSIKDEIYIAMKIELALA